MSDNAADMIVLGAGPGGYSAAFRAADLGRDVLLIDPRTTLGGVCLNEGCIPSKALLHASNIIREVEEISKWGVQFGKPQIDLTALRTTKSNIVSTLTDGLDGIAARRRVKLLRGKARFVSFNQIELNGKIWSFEDAVIAVGSSPIELTSWPVDDRIWNSTSALELRSIPKRLVIVGGGIIGLEMATIYAALGSKVKVIEQGPRIAPGADESAVRILHDELEQQGIEIHCQTKIASVFSSLEKLTLVCEGLAPGKIFADVVIQSVGRRSNGASVSPEVAGIRLDASGAIEIKSDCRTHNKRIFAIGDVTGSPMLAHRAAHQGKVAAEAACGKESAMLASVIPSVAYTRPELAWVGDVKGETAGSKRTQFPWVASGRNLASGGGKGMTTITYCQNSGVVLGGSIVGQNAGELLAEITLAIEMGAKLEDLCMTIHAHPTLSETIAFSAERALGTLLEL